LWDEALVIFMTDHGDMLGSHSLFQKMCMYEDSAHIPLLVKPPGSRRVERAGSLVSHLDIAATICEYLDLPALPESDGVSLVPALEGKAEAVREQVFIEFNGNSGRGFEQRCLVRGDWKYIYTKGDRDELYNLKDDADETRNVAGDAAFETTRLELRGRLAAIMRGTADRIETPN
jgi:arylsulfatase A-like enzyme